MGRKPVIGRETKKCPQCKEVKPVSEWYKNKRQPDGFSAWCKDCTKDYHYQNRDQRNAHSRDYHKTERGKQVEKEYLRTETGRATRRRIRKRRYNTDKEFRERCRARSAISNAIRLGLMLPAKSQTCTRCGEQAQQYHHHNGYEREHWLDVIAVCRSCHKYLEEIRQQIANGTGLV